MIELHRPQGSIKNSVTIVFDGQPGIVGRARASSVRVVFSENESADDRIKAMVERSPAPKSTVVVTNDKEIKFRVRSLGAQVLGVEEFFARMSSRPQGTAPGKSKKSSREDAKVISKTLEYEITTEFEKIWLKGDKKDDDRPRIGH